MNEATFSQSVITVLWTRFVYKILYNKRLENKSPVMSWHNDNDKVIKIVLSWIGSLYNTLQNPKASKSVELYVVKKRLLTDFEAGTEVVKIQVRSCCPLNWSVESGKSSLSKNVSFPKSRRRKILSEELETFLSNQVFIPWTRLPPPILILRSHRPRAARPTFSQS